MNHLRAAHESLIAFLSGAFGFFALINTWQEQIEWFLRITLLILSITATAIGLWLAVTNKDRKRRR